jgi:arylformamidase
MRLIDITVPISAKTPTYPGDPGIEIQQWSSISAGDAANVTMLHFGAHTATHVDAPAHFIEGASRVDAMPLEVLIGRVRVVEFPHELTAIRASDLPELDEVERILFKTRNSSFWADTSTGFRTDFTYITVEAATALVNADIKLVGMDYLSVEQFKSGTHETHTCLLSRGVVIVEGLDLREVSAGEYELICLPLKLALGTGDGAPARVVLRTLN